MPQNQPEPIPESPPSAEDVSFGNWRQMEETKRFFRYLKDLRERTKEDWASRMYVKGNNSESEANNYEALGSVAVLQDLLDLSNHDIEDFYNANRN